MKLMSVKKQIPSFCKLYSFYEEIPEEFSDETDVDCYFYHNTSDISQSQHRIVRVSRELNKKSFAIKLFQFCYLEKKHRYILQEEVNISKSELTSLVDTLRNFLKLLITLASVYRFPYRSPMLRLDLQSQKTTTLLFIEKISLNIQKGEFVCRSDLETTNVASFP